MFSRTITLPLFFILEAHPQTITPTYITLFQYQFPIYYHLLEQNSAQDCTEVGRFPIYGTSCKSYVHCTYSGGVYYSTAAYCPGSSYFNPRSQKCTSAYTCGDTFCARVLNMAVKTAADFLDPNYSDMRSYIRCVYNGSAIIPLYLKCPKNFVVYVGFANNEGCCPDIYCKRQKL